MNREQVRDVAERTLLAVDGGRDKLHPELYGFLRGLVTSALQDWEDCALRLQLRPDDVLALRLRSRAEDTISDLFRLYYRMDPL